MIKIKIKHAVSGENYIGDFTIVDTLEEGEILIENAINENRKDNFGYFSMTSNGKRIMISGEILKNCFIEIWDEDEQDKTMIG